MSFIIAIAGGSGSGKTTIARRLRDLLGANLIAEDDYYICRTHYPNFDPLTHNFDTPLAKEHRLLVAQLAAARRGEAFDKPVYCLKTHSREPQIERIAPRDFLVLDGIHAFATEDLRAVSDYKIFVDTDEAVRLRRRIARDLADRARDLDEIGTQFAANVVPAHAQWVEPQRACADLVIRDSGGDDFTEAEAHAARIAEIVRAKAHG